MWKKRKKTPFLEIKISLKEGINEYETKFFYGGFKYAGILENNGVEVLEIKQIAISTEMDRVSTFECSSDLINTFYNNTVRSCTSNFLDIPTDGPTRERMGWMGILKLFLIQLHIYSIAMLFSKNI